jgi:hypothetical protein
MPLISSFDSSPSLPPSSPSQPIRYFDLLPTELIRNIFDLVDALPRSSRRIRRKTLHSLCLVSKLLRSLAQPLLLKHVGIWSTTKPNLLQLLADRNSDPSLGAVQTFYFDSPGPGFQHDGLAQLANKMLNLQKVYICQD